MAIMTKARRAERKAALLRDAGMAFRDYALDRPEATIGTLREFVETAMSQCLDFDEDEPIDEDEVPSELGEYLHLFAVDPDDVDPVLGPTTYGCRLANLEEDGEFLTELAELVGDDFPLSELPRPIFVVPALTPEEFAERVRSGESV